MKTFILGLMSHTKRVVSGDIEVDIVFVSLLSVYVIDIIFYRENNIGVICVAMAVGLFRWFRGLDESRG